VEQTYFRRGFGLKSDIEGALTADYHSRVVDRIRAQGYVLTMGDLTFKLAREFGFCYGVDRAVEYAYETRTKFPERRVFLVGEIIHNPHVNKKLQSMGVEFLHRPDEGEFDFRGITPADVVILPAFGVTVKDFERLRAVGCVLVDTTCGSVLNVWKRVDSYAKDGFTAVVHGKYYHEETKATSSQVTKYPGGKYLVVRDMAEAREVCAYIEGAGSGERFLELFADKLSPGFDPDRDLVRVGVANQTTMLSGESLAIAAEIRRSMAQRYGEAALPEHFRTFDTICSATQDRQDDRGIQLEQHDAPRRHLPRQGADLSHRGRELHRPGGRDDPVPPSGGHAGAARERVAPCGAPDRGSDRGRVDPEQQDWGDGRADRRGARGVAASVNLRHI